LPHPFPARWVNTESFLKRFLFSKELVMKNLPKALWKARTQSRFLVLAALLAAVAALAPLSNATAPLTITVVNNSDKQIRHFYLSPANSDNWGPDQLSSPISAGATQTLNVSWDQSTVKLVAEDQDGCFMYQTAEANGSLTWTINSGTARDCGD
jgi:hypothetical protein